VHRFYSAYDPVLGALPALRKLQSRRHPSLMLRFPGGHEKLQSGLEDAHLRIICHYDHGLLRHILWNTHGHLSNTMKRSND
jgi:hypothetical protein